MTAFIASVRLKSTGEVFYRIKGQLSSWTKVRDGASHFPTRDEAERAIQKVSADRYDKFVGTAREVADELDGPKFIAAVRYKETGMVHYRVAPTYPHTGEGPVWSTDIKDAHEFNHKEAADHVLRLRVYEKKVGTPSEVKLWAKQLNAGIKKIADVATAPALFVPTDQVGSMVLGQDFDIKFDEVETPETDHTAGSNDMTHLDVIETYIEKAQKIEEEGADEYTWRGFLHAFLKDIMETRK